MGLLKRPYFLSFSKSTSHRVAARWPATSQRTKREKLHRDPDLDTANIEGVAHSLTPFDPIVSLVSTVRDSFWWDLAAA